MIDPYLYEPIYLIFCSVLLLIVANNYKVCNFFEYNNRCSTKLGTCTIAVFLTLYFGFRPLHAVFVDTLNYEESYKAVFGCPFYFEIDTNNFIFDNILTFMASQRIPVEYFFLVCAFLFFVPLVLFCLKMFPKDCLLIFLVCCTSFSAFSSITNGVKAGIAANFYLLAFAYYDKIKLALLFALMSIGFHHSMKVVLVASLIAYFFKKDKYYYALWILCILISAAHITFFQEVFAMFSDEQGKGYLIGYDEGGYYTGFRPDFILYSATPVAIYHWLSRKNIFQPKDLYSFCIRTYMLTNSVWMLCMYASFTNRIAYLSWFMLPLMLVLPFFDKFWSDYQLVYGKKAALYHMVFTLFMAFIFYGF